ncbi:MAG: Ig-like domain-containing protein [Phototrophicaceae bacterium]
MFKISRRMLISILIAMLTITIVPQVAMAQDAPPESGLTQACAATPNAFGGQGFTFAGQGFTFAGQGFTFAGQGFTFAGQGFTFAGQGFTFAGQSVEELQQELLDNIIDPAWTGTLFSNLTEGEEYGNADSAIIVIDDADHGQDVLATFDALNDYLQSQEIPTIDIYFIDIGVPSINYESEAIAAAIDAQVTALQTGEGNYEHIVLNMSFAFIPCEDTETGFNYYDFLAERDAQEANAASGSGESTRNIIPILECVYEVTGNTYMARFGYDNQNDQTVYVDAGWRNTLSTWNNSTLPILFESGEKEAVFEVSFSRRLSWRIISPNGKRIRSVIATRHSPICDDAPEIYTPPVTAHGGEGYYCQNRNDQHPRGRSLARQFDAPYSYIIGLHCGDEGKAMGWGKIRKYLCDNPYVPPTPPTPPQIYVTPIVECVAYDPETNQFIARFGYENPNDRSVYIPISSDNAFSEHTYRGQPTYFLSGRSNTVFEVSFTEGQSVSWTVTVGNNAPQTVTANIGTIECFDDLGYTLGDYFEDLGYSPDETLTILIGFLVNVEDTTDLSALRNLLADYLVANVESGNTQTVLTVASSGNYAPWVGGTPLTPAKWSETIAVAATLGDNIKSDEGQWLFSQDGNIRAPGAAYQFIIPGVGGEPDTTRIIAGTSFAGPGAAFILAQYGQYPAACETQLLPDGSYLPPLKDGGLINAPLVMGISNPLACNLDPVAVDEGNDGGEDFPQTDFVVENGGTLSVIEESVLDNDFDFDDDPLSVVVELTSSPFSGELSMNANGTFTYVHNGSNTRFDSFEYTITDGSSPEGTATATVYIEILPAESGLTVEDIADQFNTEGDIITPVPIVISSGSGEYDVNIEGLPEGLSLNEGYIIVGQISDGAASEGGAVLVTVTVFDYSTEETVSVSFLWDVNFRGFDSSISVTGFLLIDAITGEVFGEITDGTTIDIVEFSNPLSILAITSAEGSTTVESVLLVDDYGERIDSDSPFIRTGSEGIPFVVGEYRLFAIPYTEINKQGDRGFSSSINLTIINSGE